MDFNCEEWVPIWGCCNSSLSWWHSCSWMRNILLFLPSSHWSVLVSWHKSDSCTTCWTLKCWYYDNITAVTFSTLQMFFGIGRILFFHLTRTHLKKCRMWKWYITSIFFSKDVLMCDVDLSSFSVLEWTWKLCTININSNISFRNCFQKLEWLQ